MNTSSIRTLLARLFGLGAVACGIIGLIVGLIERAARLGPVGWFTGGSLLALVAIILLLDELASSKQRQ